ncbi:PREDICTED: uncharacterized protein LOC108771578 [Cyphomyrmex costatus]|uniref:uncharacterized protein LOC108771578 n=1 Tax=Cyphomyrmex costatus TaxID=456900 RepID=UPI0008522CA9|nr:PREDICTED: uncharacterized protein LOC108771578 [Cyphomyrmex costatus]
MGDESVYFYTEVSPSGEKQIFTIDASKIQEFLMNSNVQTSLDGKNLTSNAEKSIVLEPEECIANNFDTPASSNSFTISSTEVFGKSALEFHTAKAKSEKIVNWSTAQIKLLIEKRLAFDDLFTDPKCKKTKYWEKISKEFAQHGYPHSAADLQAKWKNLMVTYNRNVDKMKKSGESAITWEYFELMHAVFSHKKSVCPAPETLGSTLKISNPIHSAMTYNVIDESPSVIHNAELLNDSDTTQCSEDIENSPINKVFDNSPSSKKKRNNRFCQDNVLNFKKTRWEEKKKIEQNKIDVLICDKFF